MTTDLIQPPTCTTTMQHKPVKKVITRNKPVFTAEQSRIDEIMSSFRHALYIQQSVFGSPAEFVNRLGFESFFMFKPKDKVSGDFYWTQEITDSIIIVVGDCTGHGMPGAFLSLFAQSACSRAVTENRLTNPVDIINKMNAVFNGTFGVNGPHGCVGMDVSVCVINKRTLTMECAGAGNPVWLVRDNQLTELKGGRCAVGQFAPLSTIPCHQIQLKTNDVLYMFTDGFEDQFGRSGLTGKTGKFLRKRLRHTLVKTSALPIHKQENYLGSILENWQQDCEQTDDISMLGLKIS